MPPPMHPRPRAARPTLPRRAPDLFSPHPLDPTRRHPHRRRRRSPPFARRHGYCTAVVLCVAAMCLRGAGQRSAPANLYRYPVPTVILERRILQVVRGVMAIFVNAKNTQTTALRVRTGLTEHTCKGLGPVEAPTPRYTHDCARIFPFLAMLATSSAPVH